jgi:hypothetical protein
LSRGGGPEAKIYRAWLSHLIPELRRMARYDELIPDSYFLFSAEGYPSIILEHIPNSIEDINRIGGYDYFIVALDADQSTVQDRIDEINESLSDKQIHLIGTELRIVVQNRYIETWLLGNRRIVRRNPTSLALQEYLGHYDVRLENPELMPEHADFNTHAQFHARYLKEVFRERNIHYSKKQPGHALDRRYLEELISRVNDEPSHLGSLKVFLDFCSLVRSQIASDAPLFGAD